MRLFRRRCSEPTPTGATVTTQCGPLAAVPPLPDEYQMVTAMPAVVLPEGDSPKESRRVFTTWGRRVGRKLEQLRRGDSKESLNGTSFGSSLRKRSWRLGRSASDSRSDASPSANEETALRPSKGKADRAESIKSFLFFRMGSTGALHTYSPSTCDPTPHKRQLPTGNPARLPSGTAGGPSLAALPTNGVLLRSCSTSQLSTYVRGEDPTDGLDLSTPKCDPSQNRGSALPLVDRSGSSGDSDAASVAGSDTSSTYVPTKTMSCDNISALGTGASSGRKGHFPYAFLRSKLSVLPEENGGSVVSRRRARSQGVPAPLYSSPGDEEEESAVPGGGPQSRACLGAGNSSSPPTLRASRLRATSEELFQRLSGPHSEGTCRLPQGTRTLGRKGDFFETRSLRLHNPMSQSYAAIPFRHDDVFLPLSTTKLSVAPPLHHQPPPPLYISSNESGYDSDGPRHGDEGSDSGRGPPSGTGARVTPSETMAPGGPHGVPAAVPGADAEDGDSGIANESSDSGSLHDSELGPPAGVEGSKDAASKSSEKGDELQSHGGGSWGSLSKRQRRLSTAIPGVPRSCSSDASLFQQRAGEAVGCGWERRGASGKLLLTTQMTPEASLGGRFQFQPSLYDSPSETIQESAVEGMSTGAKGSSCGHSGQEEATKEAAGSRVVFRRHQVVQEAGGPVSRRMPDPGSSSSSVLSEKVRSQSGALKAAACRKFKLIRLTRSGNPDLGVYITPKQLYGPLGVASVNGYVIVRLENGGVAQRDGRLLIGDEIVNVNGRLLRGATHDEAREILKSPGVDEVDIVVARDETCPPARERGIPAGLPPTVSHPPSATSVASPSSRTVSRSNSPATVPLSATSSRNLSWGSARSSRSREEKGSATSSSSTASAVATPVRARPRPPAPVSPSPATLHTIVFEKGSGRKSLGFSIVGGRDSPKGSMGIFVKTIFPTGQAAEEGKLVEGDEVLAVNGEAMQGLSHAEAIALFKKIRSGQLALSIARRQQQMVTAVQRQQTATASSRSSKSKSCENLEAE